MAPQRKSSSLSVPSNPSLEDVKCPICLCILIEPVTMPCSHSLCMPCFDQHVAKASLSCPVCRTRISVWVRRNNTPSRLINKRLWQIIQEKFPSKVESRLQGVDESNSEELVVPVQNVCAPGEIREEYEKLLKQQQQELAERQLQEELESNRLIQKLQEDEKMQLRERRVQQDNISETDKLIAYHIKEAEMKHLEEKLEELRKMCDNDEEVAREIEAEERRVQKKLSLSQTNKKKGRTPAHGPMDVYIDRNMSLKSASQDMSNTPTTSLATESGTSFGTEHSIRANGSSDSRNNRIGRQLRDITSSQSSESETDEVPSSPTLKRRQSSKYGKENSLKNKKRHLCIEKLKDKDENTNYLEKSNEYTCAINLSRVCIPSVDDSDETDIDEEYSLESENAVSGKRKQASSKGGTTQCNSGRNGNTTSKKESEMAIPLSASRSENEVQDLKRIDSGMKADIATLLDSSDADGEALAALIAEQEMVETKLRQEEEDRLLALALQKEFARQRNQIDRSRGSEDEYVLRNRKSQAGPSSASSSSIHRSPLQKKARQTTLLETIAKRQRNN